MPKIEEIEKRLKDMENLEAVRKSAGENGVGTALVLYPSVLQVYPQRLARTSARATAERARKYERLWPVSAVFTALRQAGVIIEKFGEHPDEYWNPFPNLKPELRGQIPMTFSMLARRGD